MKRFLAFMFVIAPIVTIAQSNVYLRADTVNVMQNNEPAEFRIKNKTKDSTKGLLVNIGNGVTAFIKNKKINDTLLKIGLDTFPVGAGAASGGFISYIKKINFDTLAKLRLSENTIFYKGLLQDFGGLGTRDRNVGGALTTDTTISHVVDAFSVGANSVASVRALDLPNNQFHIRLSDQQSKFIQDYQYDVADVSTADDGYLTLVGPSGQRYKAVVYNYVNAKLFRLDASLSDNSVQLQNAVNAVSSYSGTHLLLISNGTYAITSNVTVPNNVTLYIGPGAKLTGSAIISGGILKGDFRQQLFTLGITVHPSAVADGWFSMLWYGAAGTGLVDDQPALQKCWDVCAYQNKIKAIWWPTGVYRIDKGLLFERDDNGDGSRDFPTGYIIQGESQAFGGSGEVVINLNNNASFALGFQKCKGLMVKNLYVDGGNSAIAALTYSQVFEGDGSLWDNGFRTQINSPQICFVVDPVGIPAMGSGTKYPDFVAKYTDPSSGGSTDVTFDHCAAFNAIGGFGISVNGTTQNGDLMECNACWAYQLKYSFITGSSQNRSFKINKCGVWGRVFTIFDCRTFGDNIGDPPQVEELNTAGLNKYLCDLNTFANNGLTINNSHFESLWSLGGCFTSQSGKLVINNTWAAMAGSFLPGDGTATHPPKTIFRGSTLSMMNSFFSYYQSGTTPMSIAVSQGLFKNTNLDNVVINAVSTGVITFTHCTGGGSTYPWGDGDIIANIDPNQFQNNHTLFTTDMELVPDVFAGDFFVSLTRKKVNRTRGQFGFGGKDYQEINLGTYTPSNIVAVNGAQNSSTADLTLTPGSTELKILQIGDYLLCQSTDEYGRANSTTCMGQIYAIDAGTGVVSLKTTMIGLSAISYANVRLYRQHELIAGFAVGDSHAGSNIIDNVETELSVTQFPIGVTLNSNNFPEGTWVQSYNSGTHQLTVSNNATTSQTTMDILSSDWQMTQYGYPNTSLGARIGYKQGDIIWNKRQDLNADIVFWVCSQSGITASSKLPKFVAYYKNNVPELSADADADAWGVRLYYKTGTTSIRFKNGSTWSDIPTSAGFSNPMTTKGDLIYGETSGAPTRLPAGTAGYILQTQGTSAAPTYLAYSSGAFTPTITNTTNVDATTAYSCWYFRIGDDVTFWGKVDVDPTATTLTEIGISLPVASGFSVDNDLVGTIGSGFNFASIFAADIANNRAKLSFSAPGTTNFTIYFHGSYHITPP